MTIEKLLGQSSATLKAMSTKELHDYFAPFLDVTRPERARQLVPTKTSAPKVSSLLKQKTALANELLKQAGLDLKI